MNIRFEKIVHTLERDIRNQGVIERLKHPTRKDRLMIYMEDNARRFAIMFFVMALAFFAVAVTRAFAAECPDPGVKCKVLYLTEQEEKILMGQNGILDTAAQARALELGQFSVYLKTRIGSAPQGDVKAVEKPGEPAK